MMMATIDITPEMRRCHACGGRAEPDAEVAGRMRCTRCNRGWHWPVVPRQCWRCEGAIVPGPWLTSWGQTWACNACGIRVPNGDWGMASPAAPRVEIAGDRARVTFAAPFDLASYALFLRCKRLPESELGYEWRTDTYTLTTPARYVGTLTGEGQAEPEAAIDLAPHLFDYQAAIVRRALAARRYAVWADTGLGKALHADTRVVTPRGYRRIADLRPGDIVTGCNGRGVGVLGVYPQGERPAYRVSFSDGTSVVCDREHLWTVTTKLRRSRGMPARTLTLREVQDEGLRDQEGWRHFIPLPAPVEFEGGVLPLEPYLVGVLLGDGGLSGHDPILTTADDEMLANIAPLLPGSVRPVHLGRYDYRLSKPEIGRLPNPVKAALAKLGLMGHRAESKFIPDLYKFASASAREALLQGLLDTDGHVRPADNNIEYCTVSATLAADVAWLIRSLGGTARVRTKRTTGRTAYRMSVILPGSVTPFRLSRKALVYHPREKYQPVRAIVGIEEAGTAEMVCIKVDAPDSLFLVEEFVATHNTSIFMEWTRQAVLATGGRVLILSPLQIIEQTRAEAARWYGDALPIERIDSRESLAVWCKGDGPAVGITNYEKLIPGVLPEMHQLTGLVLDEASILKTGAGVIKWNLIKSAKGIPYKLACTATPAPNDTMEYASQASFLEKLKTESDILWTFFTRDKFGNWSVKPHATEAFYRFMASWSIYLRSPAHYGWADVLAGLPDPVYHEERLPLTDEQRTELHRLQVRAGTGMFSDRMGVKERSKASQIAKGFLYEGTGKARSVRRLPSHKPRRVADIVRAEVACGRQVLVWTVFDEESAIIADLLAEAPFSVGTLHGDMAAEARGATIDAFKRGDLAVLITKAQLVGYGLNFQNCRAMVFSGFDDCYDEQTEVLTQRGWCSFGDLTTEDTVASVNPTTLGFAWQQPERIVWTRYTGPMFRFHGAQSHDLLVTPNHKLLVKRCDMRYGRNAGEWHLRYAADLATNYRRQEYRMLSAPRSFAGEHPPEVVVPVPSNMRAVGARVRLIERIDIEDFVRLAGWYLSEGYCRPDNSRERGRIVISQTDRHPEHRSEIIELLGRIGLRVNAKTKDITGYSTNLALYLMQEFGDSSHNKRIPQWVKNLNQPLLVLLRDTMIKGDGCHSRGRVNGYRSVSRQLIDDFQEVCLKTGIRASVRNIADVASNSGRFKHGYCGSVSFGWEHTEPSIHRRPQVVDYDGMIGCVTVPNHLIIVRRNGVPVVSGNSFERMYQAIRRAYRFGQTEAVHVHIPYIPELEGMIFSNIRAKEAAFDRDVRLMEQHYIKVLREGDA